MEHQDPIRQGRQIDDAERARCIPDPDFAHIRADRFIGFQSSGSLPTCTMNNSYPARLLATSGNAELFRLSGNRDPYQSPTLTESDGAARPPHHNRLGVLAEGAWADMLLVDGDPTRDLGLLGDPDSNLRLIIKDGRVHKNTL